MPDYSSEIAFNPYMSGWWPIWDTKAERNHAYILKHLCDMDLAVSLCPDKRVCIQAGGHVGLWPKALSKYFHTVLAFECEPSLFEAMKRNLEDYNQITVSDKALSDKEGQLLIKRSGSSGSNRIGVENANIPIDAITIDSLNLDVCDAIFLDVEHHEIFALRGAVETIKRCRPVLQVEELDVDNTEVRDFLATLGYTKVSKQGKDSIYTCQGAV